MQTDHRSPHEHLLQVLSDMLIQVNALHTLVHKETNGPSASIQTMHEGLATLEQMTREALYMVRTSSDDALPDALGGMTLAEALSRLVEGTAEELGLSSHISISGVDEQGRSQGQSLARKAEHLLYLIAQEALYEVQQRTGARRLRLTLNYGPHDVQMGIEDDGLNATPSPATETDGDAPPPPFAAVPSSTQSERTDASIIKDLRSHIECLGGTLEVTPLGERGTRVLARLPYVSDALPLVQSEEHVDTENGNAAPEQRSPANPPPSPNVERIRILVVDGQAVTRAGLHRLLESYPDLQVVGEAADGVQAVSEALELGPQVVIMDAQMPEGQSLEALHQIKQLNLDTRVLLLSTQDREEYLYETLRAGADGYVLKDIAPDELAQAVRTVARGEVLIQPQIAGRLLSRFGRQGNGNTRYDTLTAREQEVLRLLARGLRNKEIAAQLYLSERTVNFHLANIYQKLNVSGRTEALSKAIEQGLIKV